MDRPPPAKNRAIHLAGSPAGFLAKLGVLGCLLAAFAASPAGAETNFPVIGGSGTGSFEDRCPAGDYLIGILGRAGSWVNQVQIFCAPVTRSLKSPSVIQVHEMDSDGGSVLYHGPMRGGQGGGAARAGCAGINVEGVVRGIWPHMTPGNRQAKYIDVWCLNSTSHNSGTDRFNKAANPFTDVNGGSDQPQQQICPDGEVAVGLRGRYGEDVNAISLICGAFNPPTPPPAARAQAPRLANEGAPIKTTGRAAGQPPPSTSSRPVSLLDGSWRVTPSLGGPFTLYLRLVAGATIGGQITSAGTPSDAGSLHGRQLDQLHAQLSFTQPGANRTGAITITITGDGTTFTGLGQLATGEPLTWQGAKNP